MTEPASAMDRLAPRLLALAAAALLLAGCGHWQARADALQKSLEDQGAKGGRKADFVQRYGAPSSCMPVTAGELCRWVAPMGAPRAGKAVSILRVAFDKSGGFVGATARVRRGRRTYRGSTLDTEPAAADSDADCPEGEISQDGECAPTSPAEDRPQANPVESTGE